MKILHIAVLTALLAPTLVGCRKYEPIGPQCERKELPAGAVMKTVSAGGIDGHYESHTYFEDGRVLVATGYPSAGPQKEVTTNIPPDRLRKLDGDLTASGLFDAKEGCWSARKTIPDGSTVILVVRHGGKAYSYESSDGPPPRVVEAAFGVAYAIENEVDQQVRAAADGGVDAAR